MNQPTLIITVGTPASGKSSVARRYVEAHPDTLIVERDEIRAELGGSRQYFDQEGKVTFISQGRVRTALLSGIDVIVSDTNARSRVRREWRKIADECGANFVTWWMTTSLEDAIAMNTLRPDGERVPEDVIHKMWDQLATTPPEDAIRVDIDAMP